MCCCKQNTTDAVLFLSEDLRTFIDFSVKTYTKRIDLVLRTVADFFNLHVFGPNGPVDPLKGTLGYNGTGSLLREFIPPGYTGLNFPKSLGEAKIFPLPYAASDQLVLALGYLRSFDAEQNNADPEAQPQSSFYNKSAIIRGLHKLDVYGPMAFELLYSVASALGGLFAQSICCVESPKEVLEAAAISLTWQVCRRPPSALLDSIDISGPDVCFVFGTQDSCLQ